MRRSLNFLRVVSLCGFAGVSTVAQTPPCPDRPVAGSEVVDPLALQSENGILNVALVMRNLTAQDGVMHYCYTYQDTIEAPTLRVNPGDQITLDLTNQIQQPQDSRTHMQHAAAAPAADPCAGTMTEASTNVHFHGLNVPATCHQDEVVHTLINPADPPFGYQIRVPFNEPPGLYWYHPHPHGMTQQQVMGGASGVIIVEGMEKIKPEVAGLTERVLILRDQLTEEDPDASDLTLNFVPANPGAPAPVIRMKPLEKQFWRVLNATGRTFVALQVQFNTTPQNLRVVALDGSPVKTDLRLKTISLPPAGRAEFIVQGPPEGVPAALVTLGVNTGREGDPNPPQLIADIVSGAGVAARRATVPASPALQGPRRFTDLRAQVPRVVRKLMFTEDLSDPSNPKFFITVVGQEPKLFDPDDPPAIITQQGTVEDWIIQNRSDGIHAFHIHQLHFLLMERNGVPVSSPNLLDTVNVPPWDHASGTFPSVRIRLDFRYPETVGTFVYHCHILGHEDHGMMAKIQVDPR